jgi:hypothetical protein
MIQKIRAKLRRKVLGAPLLTFDDIAAELWDVQMVGSAMIAFEEGPA